MANRTLVDSWNIWSCIAVIACLLVALLRMFLQNYILEDLEATSVLQSTVILIELRTSTTYRAAIPWSEAELVHRFVHLQVSVPR